MELEPGQVWVLGEAVAARTQQPPCPPRMLWSRRATLLQPRRATCGGLPSVISGAPATENGCTYIANLLGATPQRPRDVCRRRQPCRQCRGHCRARQQARVGSPPTVAVRRCHECIDGRLHVCVTIRMLASGELNGWGSYVGEIGDVVVGRVVEVSAKRWKVDINARQV